VDQVSNGREAEIEVGEVREVVWSGDRLKSWHMVMALEATGDPCVREIRRWRDGREVGCQAEWGGSRRQGWVKNHLVPQDTLDAWSELWRFLPAPEPAPAPVAYKSTWLEGTPEETPVQTPAPTPTASQHPADLKPRGVKAPLYLLPWSTIPEDFVPVPLRDAAARAGAWPDGDRVVPDRDVPARAAMPRALIRSLLGVSSLEDAARAFEYGAAKYARDNWRSFAWDDRARDEYFGAICRHLVARANGEIAAQDSGVSHYGHALAGAMIWAWHEARA
jgi:hypothetical protein